MYVYTHTDIHMHRKKYICLS